MNATVRKLDCGWYVPTGVYGKRYFDTCDASGVPAIDRRTYSTARSFCRYPGTALDGGAYVGVWSCYMARDFARVVAVEPDAVNYECLKLNVLPRYSNVTCIRAALVQSPGAYNFVPGRAKAFNRTVEPVDPEVGGFPGVTIDSLGIKNLALLKLDVEGYEQQALLGAMATLRACKPVVVIEEKKDESLRARQVLTELGMVEVFADKVDHVFVWE